MVFNVCYYLDNTMLYLFTIDANLYHKSEIGCLHIIKDEHLYLVYIYIVNK